MEKNQLIAVVVIVIVIGGAGAYLLLQPAGDEYDPPLPSEPVTPTGDSAYVIATGEFDCIDVYSYYQSDADEVYTHHAHIEYSGEKYAMGRTYDESFGDSGVNKLHVFMFNGTMHDRQFILDSFRVYNFELFGIQFEFYLHD